MIDRNTHEWLWDVKYKKDNVLVSESKWKTKAVKIKNEPNDYIGWWLMKDAVSCRWPKRKQITWSFSLLNVTCVNFPNIWWWSQFLLWLPIIVKIRPKKWGSVKRFHFELLPLLWCSVQCMPFIVCGPKSHKQFI